MADAREIEAGCGAALLSAVGWLFADNKDCKVIVPHIGGQRDKDEMMQGCGDLTIPAAPIVKMTTLRR